MSSPIGAGPSGVPLSSSYKEYNQGVIEEAVRLTVRNNLFRNNPSRKVTGYRSPRGHVYVVKRNSLEGGNLIRLFLDKIPHTVMPVGLYKNFGIMGNRNYVVMEAGKCTLRHIISPETRIEPSIICVIISQLTHYLSDLKNKGLVHLDLKPLNTVIQGNDQIVVIDVEGIIPIDNHQMKDYRCTLNFAAPEVFLSKYFSKESPYKVGFASDIWSLACILFEMITREPLFNSLRGEYLFRGKYLSGFEKNLARLYQLEIVLGMPLPDELKQEIHNSSKNKYFKEKNGSLELVPIRKEIRFLSSWKQRINNSLPEEEARKYIPLISGMLEIDPNKRTTIEAVHEFFMENMMIVSLQVTNSVLQMREHFILRLRHGCIEKKYYVSGNKPWDCIHFPKDAESNEPLILELFLRRCKNNEICWLCMDRKETLVQELNTIIIATDEKGSYTTLTG